MGKFTKKKIARYKTGVKFIGEVSQFFLQIFKEKPCNGITSEKIVHEYNFPCRGTKKTEKNVKIFRFRRRIMEN